jgi:hypothetical protein
MMGNRTARKISLRLSGSLDEQDSRLAVRAMREARAASRSNYDHRIRCPPSSYEELTIGAPSALRNGASLLVSQIAELAGLESAEDVFHGFGMDRYISLEREIEGRDREEDEGDY